METLKRKISPQNYETVTSDLALFDWVVVDATFDGGDSTYHTTLQRDDTTPYYEDLKKLEKQWNELAKNIPMWPIAFFLLPAFILVTVYFAIAYSGLYESFNTTGVYCAFFIPAGVLLVGAVVYTGIRAYTYQKKVRNNDKYREEIREKVLKLKGEIREENEEISS